jgi:hypothetical protein
MTLDPSLHLTPRMSLGDWMYQSSPPGFGVTSSSTHLIEKWTTAGQSFSKETPAGHGIAGI